MLKYLFGLNLDGCPTPNAWLGIGKCVCGPNSFLSALEATLGIPFTEVNPLERTIAYRDCINETLSADQPHAASFELDPLATAQLLLTWRDELTEAGWIYSSNHDDATDRLKTLSTIEESFQRTDFCTSCTASRIASITNEIKLCARPFQGELLVIDKPESLPHCWAQLFQILGADYVDFSPTGAIAKDGTLLREVQKNVYGEQFCGSKKDNSVRIITAATSEEALNALACQLTTLPLYDCTLIADDSELPKINQQLQDSPRFPTKFESAAAILQLPALFIRSCLAPFNPQAYLEFLLHSISPVPKALRNSLADSINNTPGHGPHWNEALEKTIERIDLEPDAETKLREAYQQWVQPASLDPDYLTGQGLADKLVPLHQWVNKVAAAKNQSLDGSEWKAASGAISRLVQLLSKEDALTLVKLDRLISQWFSSVASSEKYSGEVGAAQHATTPAQLLEPRQHIIWWRPSNATPARSPWSPEELSWFESVGISVLDVSQQTLALEQSSINAALLATQSLTIYHVSQSQGTTTPHAGILTRLTAICGESIIESARANVATENIPTHPLPMKRRWWNFEQQGLFPARPTESYSSVSKMIDTPFIWLLDYHARLRPGKAFDYRVKDTPLRSGSIQHALAEHLFEPATGIDWNTIQETEFHTKVESILTNLFATEGAHYLIHGNEAARASLIYNAKQTFWSLTQILRQAEITEVTMEKSIAPISFVGGALAGRIDLIARRASGETVVIDLKLGGKEPREKELKENRHLQLAIYGRLMLMSENVDPATAYFILKSGGSLLTRNEGFFSEIRAITPKGDSPEGDWKECWDEFEDVYQWRRYQLDDGKVEVPIPDTSPTTDPDDAPPFSRWGPQKDACKYSAYDALTGWKSND